VAWTGCVGHECVDTQAAGAYISQALATTAGRLYNLSFTAAENGGDPSEMTIFWNGALVTDVLNPANSTAPNGVTFTFNGLLATSTSTVLELHGRQDPAYLAFDNVSVTAAVPEPQSYAMLFAGLALMGFMARRRKS